MTHVIVFLFVAFIVVPVVEIFLITQVAGQLGWPETIFLVIAVSLAGAWLVKREGLAVIRRVQVALGSAKMPTNDLADGAMIFFASALMLTPGFLTDAVGLILLLPPTRAMLRPPVISFFAKRIEVRTAGFGGAMFGRSPGFGRNVYDAPSSADLTDITDVDDPEEPRELP